jgi:putative glutamine amidotransferase
MGLGGGDRMSTRAPVIGVTRCSKLADYISSIEQAGATPRVLEVGESPRQLVADLDGVLLTGGGDIDPVLYGQARHPSVSDAEPGRDEFEIDLARRAMADDVPVLAICRGVQVLNVAAGGTLVQDIPSAIDSTLTHRVEHARDAIAHEVTVAPQSQLRSALGPAIGDGSTVRVNSRHHQSIDRVGEGLVVSATAPDGVIEAVESPATRFCVGVQWHPDKYWRTGEFQPLYAAYVRASRERGQGLGDS